MVADIRYHKLGALVEQTKINKDRYFKATEVKGGFDPTAKDRKHNLERELELRKFDDLIKQLQYLQQHPEQEFTHFDWQLDFAEILNPTIAGENAGFDVVIGNPPYMRVQEINRVMPKNKKLLEKKYAVAKKSYDLANLFFELAVRIANGRSSNCFIFPHKFFNSSSTAAFRDYLWKGKYIDKVVHFGANMVFNDADTYTCITHFSPRHNHGFSLSKISFGEDWKKALSQLDFTSIRYEKLKIASELYGTNQWIFFKEENDYRVFEKTYKNSDKFKDVFKDIFQGIATSKDPLYFLEVDNEDDQYLYGRIGLSEEALQVEKTFFKPILKGRDVQRYSSLQTSLYVFFPYQITEDKAQPIALTQLQKKYPKTYDYVMKYEKEFKARESGKAGKMKHWYGYIYPKNLTKFDQVKLSSMEICSSYPNVTLNEDFYYHSTTVYSWVTKDEVEEGYEYFLAIANSRLLWWFLMNTGDTLQSDARRFKTNYLNPFPLPKNVSKEVEALLKGKVRTVLEAKEQEEDTTAKEQEIDVLVFKLYQLTYEEALQIEPNLWLDKKAYGRVHLPES